MLTKSIIKKIVPIHKTELPKFLCMAMMIFLILYIHHSLRVAKDTLIISSLGTEAISAIKILVLPISLLFTLFYIKLSDTLTRTRLFHTMIWFFISYFVLFVTVLYPYHELLILSIPEAISTKFPTFKYFFQIISNWHYCLFFIFSELLITTLLNISFWQIANHITSIEESKRFYPLWGFASQIGLLLAGYLAKAFVTNSANYQTTLNKVILSIIIAGTFLSLSLIILGKIIGIKALNIKHNLPPTIDRKKKVKLSLKDSLKYIVTAKPILLITSLILCYNLSLNLIEGIWKKATEVYFAGNANQIHYFMGNINLYESLLCMIIALLGGYLLRVSKWKISALTTPIVVIFIGGLFFLSIFFKHSALLMAIIKVPALTVAVFSGAIYYTFAKAMKHTMFDSTKEMAFIPLADELKTKGKAAAEMVGIRLGKGSGAFIQQALLMTFTNMTLLDFAPIFFVIFSILMFLWVLSINALSRTLRIKN